MSNTKLPPIVSDDELQHIALGYYTKEHVRKYHSAKELYNASFVAAHKLRDIYEGARAKDRELIQTLVDFMQNARNSEDAPFNSINDIALFKGISLAAEYGFKPSDQ